MEQVSLTDLMAFTELIQVSFFCLFALWGVLWAGLSLQLQLPCLPLLLTVMSFTTGPCWQRGRPTWRLLWALSLSSRPIGLYSNLGPNLDLQRAQELVQRLQGQLR